MGCPEEHELVEQGPNVVSGIGTHELEGYEKVERFEGCSLLFAG